jgi:hypothetical protein
VAALLTGGHYPSVGDARHCGDTPRKYNQNMDAIRHTRLPVELWARRQRRQRIVAAIVIALLLGALVYGWLFVFGVV